METCSHNKYVSTLRIRKRWAQLCQGSVTQPVGTMDRQASASVQTPFDMCISGLFCAIRHVQIQEQPEFFVKQKGNASEMPLLD